MLRLPGNNQAAVTPKAPVRRGFFLPYNKAQIGDANQIKLVQKMPT
jgi:hypothetical protein